MIEIKSATCVPGPSNIVYESCAFLLMEAGVQTCNGASDKQNTENYREGPNSAEPPADISKDFSENKHI